MYLLLLGLTCPILVALAIGNRASRIRNAETRLDAVTQVGVILLSTWFLFEFGWR
jgi:hypothetical protein